MDSGVRLRLSDFDIVDYPTIFDANNPSLLVNNPQTIDEALAWANHLCHSGNIFVMLVGKDFMSPNKLLFPTSLCGVLVFGSALPPPALLLLLPPPPPTTCSHATCSHNLHTTCPRTICSHTTSPDLQQQVKHQSKSTNRVVLGALPRGKQVKPLVSEFGVSLNVAHSVQSDAGLQKLVRQLPKGSVIQPRLLTTWEKIRNAINKQTKKRMLEKKLEQLKRQQQPVQADLHNAAYENLHKTHGCEADSTYKLLDVEPTSDEEVFERVVIAIPREPLDFLARAIEVGHPRGMAIQLPPVLQDVIDWNRDADAFEIYKHRIDFVRFWTHKAKELSKADADLLQRALTHLQPLLKGKRLVLWQAMLEYYQYPDATLIQDVVNGFPLTGWLPDSQVFPKDYRPPNMGFMSWNR